MKYKALVGMMVVAGLSMAAWAGDIEGKVTGMKGKSVVYVDTIPGKTFPAPKDHPGHRSEGAHVLASHCRCPAGHDGGFPEQRQRGA
jgi:hypothetical protein